MRKIIVDEMDHEILILAARRTLPASIRDLVRPIKTRAISNLHNRVKKLESMGFLKTTKQCHYVLVEITEKGLTEIQLPKETGSQ